MNEWHDLAWELDRWTTDGGPARFWWRDDDATTPTPALDQLFDLSRTTGAPLALAVVPACADGALSGDLPTEVTVLQHGIAHRNHAPADAKKCELVAGTDRAALRDGRARLARLFGTSFRPVMVPPWNRIDPLITAGLVDDGFHGLSTYSPRRVVTPFPGLVQVNTHVDPVDWRGGRGFLGDGAVLGQVIGHLAARREARADPDEPTGLLSHHADFDAACWDFWAQLLQVLVDHPGADMVSVDRAFALESSEAGI